MADRAFVATRKGLFTVERTSNGTTGWKVTGNSFLGDHVPIVLHDARDGMLYASLHHGHFGTKLHRSPDGGRTWEPCGVPAYPKYPEDAEPEKDVWGRPLKWSLHMIWALEAGASPGELWCGTMPGGLFRSTDHGASWQMVESLWYHPDRKRWAGG